MVQRAYAGLGPRELAVRAFDELRPWARTLLEMQWECEPAKADWMAVGVAYDGLQTAAYHFTQRRHFYGDLEGAKPAAIAGNGRLRDRAEAVAAFVGLRPYHTHLQKMQIRCRPFGGDYLALGIALQGLDTAALHFTGEPGFYGARGDSCGPLRPSAEWKGT
jgi:hypothetical protein